MTKPISHEQREEIQKALKQNDKSRDKKSTLYRIYIIRLLSSEQAWEKEAQLQYKLFNDEIEVSRKWREENKLFGKLLERYQIDGVERAVEISELKGQLKQAMEVLKEIGSIVSQDQKSIEASRKANEFLFLLSSLSQGTEGSHESNNNNSALGDTYSDR